MREMISAVVAALMIVNMSTAFAGNSSPRPAAEPVVFSEGAQIAAEEIRQYFKGLGNGSVEATEEEVTAHLSNTIAAYSNADSPVTMTDIALIWEANGDLNPALKNQVKDAFASNSDFAEAAEKVKMGQAGTSELQILASAVNVDGSGFLDQIGETIGKYVKWAAIGFAVLLVVLIVL